ncbi:histone deacetylase family protein [Candidatus Omnitrophota bacterium]
MKIFFSKECLKYSQPGHPESPLRVSTAYEYLKEKRFDFKEPSACSESDILLAHSKELLQEVKAGNFFDADTPALDNIYHYAILSAGSAIDAALLSLKGENAFSLMRPPGHHATRDSLGGFCYFNNIAIATMRAKEAVDNIAIIDVDCHHGNGTQDIFLGRKDIIYVSLHQSPLYPGTGLESQENCFNYPLAANTGPDSYMDTLNKALDNVNKFNPGLIAVSIGFDTYKLDPITSLSLEKDTYMLIGEALSSLNRPLFCILEGGYNYQDMPQCLNCFLEGIGR